MIPYKYILGSKKPIEELYPDPKIADKSLNFQNYCDVIRHYTHSSLLSDGFNDLMYNATLSP